MDASRATELEKAVRNMTLVCLYRRQGGGGGCASVG